MRTQSAEIARMVDEMNKQRYEEQERERRLLKEQRKMEKALSRF